MSSSSLPSVAPVPVPAPSPVSTLTRSSVSVAAGVSPTAKNTQSALPRIPIMKSGSVESVKEPRRISGSFFGQKTKVFLTLPNRSLTTNFSDFRTLLLKQLTEDLHSETKAKILMGKIGFVCSKRDGSIGVFRTAKLIKNKNRDDKYLIQNAITSVFNRQPIQTMPHDFISGDRFKISDLKGLADNNVLASLFDKAQVEMDQKDRNIMGSFIMNIECIPPSMKPYAELRHNGNVPPSPQQTMVLKQLALRFLDLVEKYDPNAVATDVEPDPLTAA